MKRLLTVALTVAVVAVPSAPAAAADDPDTTLRQALANLSTAPRITSTLASEGSLKFTGRLVINTRKRYVSERMTEQGRVLTRSVETSRFAFSHNAKRHCWMKRRKRFNVSLRFKSMKRKISEVQQLAPDVIAYTHDEDLGVFRIEMRYDPATLLPIEFNATYIDDGQGDPGVKSYRMTFAYTASSKIPKHRPVCPKS